MRPSKLKTPLAKLRAMLKVQTGEKTKKRTGQTLKTYAPLSRQDVADWLGCGVDNISSIESDRVKLTEENAEIISHQTGANLDWLLAGDVIKENTNWRGVPYTQRDFDERQNVISNPSPDYDLRQSRETLASCCAKIAAVIVRGAERGKPVEYAYRLNKALRSVYFDKDENKHWPTRFSAAYSNLAVERPDFTPLFHVFENDLRKILRDKIGTPCPACLDQGVVACKCWHESKLAAERWEAAVDAWMKNKKRGVRPKQPEPLNCKICGNRRIIQCETCKGKGRVENPRR